MHSRGRFIARAKSSIFTIPATSRHRQDTPPSSPTDTPNLRIPGIQGETVELGDSPTLSIKFAPEKNLSSLLQGNIL